MQSKTVIPVVILAIAAVLSGWGSLARNRVYLTEIDLWRDCAEKGDWLDVRATVGYAIALQSTGRFEEAYEYLDRAAAVDYRQSRYSIYHLSLLIKRYASYFPPMVARSLLFQYVLELNPADEGALSYIAHSYLEEGDLENARIASSLLGRLTGYGESRSLNAALYAAYGDYKQAAANYQLAIQTEPNNSRWHEQLVLNALNFTGRDELPALLAEHRPFLAPGMIALAETVIDQRPVSAGVSPIQLASIYLARRELASAQAGLDAFLAAMQTGSVLKQDFIQAVHLLTDLGRGEDAAGFLEKLDDDSVTIDILRAETAAAAGRPETALAWYDRARDGLDADDSRFYILARKRDAALREMTNAPSAD